MFFSAEFRNRFEKPRIDERDTDLHRLGSADVVHFLDVDSAALRECAHLSLDIHHVRERIVFLHGDELLRILVGKRTEQHSIDHTEYRRVCADAESDGEDGDDGEAGGLAKHAQAIASVLQEVYKPAPAPRVARYFLSQRDTSEFLARGSLGIPRCQARFHVLSSGEFQVTLNFFVEFFIAPPPPERKSHDSFSCFAAFKMPSTAFVRRQILNRGPSSEAFHSATIQPLRSSRWRAGWSEPVSTFRISHEFVRMTLLSAYPWRGPNGGPGG